MSRQPNTLFQPGLVTLLLASVMLGANGCPVGCGIVTGLTNAKISPAPTGVSAPSPTGMAATGEVVVIPGAGHLQGAGGSIWRTDLAVRNAAADPAEIEIALLRRDQANPDPEVLRWTIAPDASLALGDVLASAFGTDGAAALSITTLSGRVVAASRTFNLGAGGATYGQLVPALGAADAIVSGDEGWLTGLTHDPGGVNGFRTNLLLVNGSAGTTTVTVRLTDGAGDSLGSFEVNLREGEAAQLNDVFERVSNNIVDVGSAIVSVSSPGARVWALASVVDNRSGDPISVTPILASAENDPSTPWKPTMVFVGAARIAGAAGTDWRTRLELTNHDANATVAVVELLPRAGGAPLSASVAIPGTGSLVYNDVLSELFDTEGAGTLRVSRFGAVTATARTYDLLAAGNPQGLPTGTTFGQSLPPFAFNQTLAAGQTAWIPLLDQAPDLSGGRRTNLLLANMGISPMTVSIELFDATGELLGTLEQDAAPGQSIQIDRIFERVTDQPVVSGSIALRHDAYGGLVAMASVVDNITGDPAAIPAIFAPAADVSGAVETAVELVGAGGADGGNMLATILAGAADGTLVDSLDTLRILNPELVTETADGTRIDFGGGATWNGGRIAQGAITVAVDPAGGGGGSFRVGLDELLVDGMQTPFEALSGTYEAHPMADGTRATIELTTPAAKVAGAGLSGSLDFDTSVCGETPIDGELVVTEGDQEYVITFGSECGDILDIEPRPESLVFAFTYRTCSGEWSATTEEIRLVRIGELVFVDPGATPSNQVGRDRWRVVGYADDIAGAKLRIVRLGAGGTPDLTAVFRGSPTRHDALVYWTGSIQITVEPNGCNRTWYLGSGDVDAWKVLQNCPDGC